MEKHITLPLTEELAKTLKAGDSVYVTGTIYLLLFWSGISISMTLIDWMIVAPMEADENGMILL